MSLISKYKISISDVLLFVGTLLLLGVVTFSNTAHRVPGFIGLVMVSGGYFWERFFTERAG